MITGIENRTVSIDLLKAHPRNYRVHPEEQISNLCASYRRFGQFRSVVAVPDGQGYLMVAGHGFVEAMRREGATEVRVEVLPVNTPASTIEAIMVADNLHAQSAQDDEHALAALLQSQVDAGFSLESMGTDEESLRQLLESLGDALDDDDDSECDEDFDGEPDEEQTRVKLGDVWKLGRHTIACINSCDINAVKKLVGTNQIAYVWSDPPYGIDIVATKGDVGGGASHMRKTGKSYLEEWQEKKNGLAPKGLGTVGGSKPFGSKSVRGTVGASNVVEAGKYAPIVGDDSTNTAIASSMLCFESFPNALQVWWGANYYANALPPSSCWIVWDKENTGNFADAELAWCSDDSAVRIFKHMWNGMLKDSEHGQKRVHPSQKPVKLAEWCFEKYGQEGDIIFDPFLGSGMSIIAAENTGRTVIGCELSPEYIDIIVARWEQHTGQQAQLLDRIEDAAHV